MRPLSLAGPILTVTLLAGACWPTAARAQATPLLGGAVAPMSGVRPAPDGSPFAKPFVGPTILCQGVERSLVVLNPEIVEGEPLLFRLLLRSTTPGRKQEFKARLSFGTDFNVNVFPPAGMAPYTYMGASRGTIVPTSTIEMTRVSAFRMPFRMAVDEETVTGAAFDRAGTFRLQFLLDCIAGDERPSRDVLAEVDVVVKPAEGDDKKALDILSSDHSVYTYIQLHTAGNGRDRAPIGDRRLALIKRVIDEAPTARVRPHAMFVLGDYLATTKTIDEGMVVYRRIITEYAGTPHEEDAWFSLLRCQSELMDYEAAFATFSRLWADPFYSQLIPPGGGYWRTYADPHLKTTVGGQWMIQDKPGPDPEDDSVAPAAGKPAAPTGALPGMPG